MKILAVDDDDFALEILPILLAEAGFHNVEVCSSAQSALNLINDESQDFDCFFLDIEMPEMDGIELCKKIRTHKKFRETPIIMLTALSDRPHIDHAFNAGATDYITKPFDVTTVGVRTRNAEKLILAQDILQERISVPLKTTNKEYKLDPSETLKAHQSLFKETQSFETVNGAIPYNALTNYLNQLSRPGLNNTNVFAIKVDQAEYINYKSTPNGFFSILNTLAEIIADTLRSKGFFLISYAGSGFFICISHSEYFETGEDAEHLIQNAINASSIINENGESIRIDISIGSPLKPFTSNYKQTGRIFRVSIARSEARFTEKKVPSELQNMEKISQ
jgi:CheY-like chemotaxis protein